MQTLVAPQGGLHPTRLQRLKDLAASTGLDMRLPEMEQGQHLARPLVGSRNQTTGINWQAQLSALDRHAQKDVAVLSRDKLIQKYGHAIADRAIAEVARQAPTPRQVFSKYQKQDRDAKRELGRGLSAAGVEVQRHSERDFTHVIVTQLDMLQAGENPSVSAVVNAAFPDDPKKATSIMNSQYGKRRRQAYNSPAVFNHPMEKVMQQTHGKGSMNRRHSARTFGQSLSMNATLFKSCDRITKLEARVQLLEQQMRETKNREALDDAGCTNSREKVLILSREGKGPAEIARLLGIPYETVRTIRRRSKQ